MTDTTAARCPQMRAHDAHIWISALSTGVAGPLPTVTHICPGINHTHDPIPIEALTMKPPETVPIIATIGHQCAECGQPCAGREYR